jgi:two-component sensor histidine kinase
VNISVGSYDRAFDFYSKALKIAEMPEYNTLLPEIYMQMAGYYKTISDSTMTFRYLDKAKLLLDPGPGNFSMLAALYLRYANYSSNRAEKEANLLKALSCSEKSEDKYLMASTNNELGLFYRETDRTLSCYYFRRALNHWIEIKSEHNIMNTWLDIIETNFVSDNYKLAVNQLDSFNILFRGALPEYIRSKYYKISYHINYKAGRYDSAFYNMKTYNELEMDKIFREEKALVDNLVSASAIKSENRRILQREDEIAQLRKLQVSLFILFFLSALSAVAFFYYNRRIRKNNLKISEQNDTISGLYQSLENQLKENNLMFKEMHHRVKNNLAMLTGIFYYQINRIQDTEARQFLTDTNARIASMAMIHELVYARNDSGTLPVGNYLEQLGMHIADIHDTPYTVNVLVICDPRIDASQKLLYQLGLITYELILNPIRNFGAKTGILKCTLIFEETETEYIFRYRDSRKNSEKGKQLMDENIPGYNLVKELSDQIGGRLNTVSAGEPEITITFPLDKSLRNTR